MQKMSRQLILVILVAAALCFSLSNNALSAEAVNLDVTLVTELNDRRKVYEEYYVMLPPKATVSYPFELWFEDERYGCELKARVSNRSAIRRTPDVGEV